ncbi:MAG: creatininase family protein [Anaerolineales bacterium]|uniref:Creatininase family protein n=1 Tax=Candidatus Desulfolinea nitratireducens TaxID=2841698 RepID=A0A8J6TJN1_9CHLR|nr:creatininase family protein [Candidatus Desulfolinea nitratireducens]MBL6959942.1 creatininase family protein [Anaerolineales bacterium]
MKWENLTSLDFENQAKQCGGVGIIPVGVLEAHASHLPLGTDLFVAYSSACRAAEIETAIVFPAYPYGINIETAHLPGGVVIKRELVFALLENICDEMYRNGLNKIILHSGHGGNRYYLPLFVQTLPEKDKSYTVYYANLEFFPGAEDILETTEYGHAGEAETSMLLHIDPDLVKMDQVPPMPFTSLKRNAELKEVGAYTQVDWYSMYPHMYVGDASKSTAEKGKTMFDHEVDALVTLIQAVKADRVTPGFVEEFNQRKSNPTTPDFWTSPGEGEK